MDWWGINERYGTNLIVTLESSSIFLEIRTTPIGYKEHLDKEMAVINEAPLQAELEEGADNIASRRPIRKVTLAGNEVKKYVAHSK